MSIKRQRKKDLRRHPFKHQFLRIAEAELLVVARMPLQTAALRPQGFQARQAS